MQGALGWVEICRWSLTKWGLDWEFSVTGENGMVRLNDVMKSANVARTIRFTEGLFEKLNQIAYKNDISFNSLVLQCCKYALEHYGEDTQ